MNMPQMHNEKELGLSQTEGIETDLADHDALLRAFVSGNVAVRRVGFE